MLRRCPALMLLALLVGLLASDRAYAHRLEAECWVLAGGQVKVESWFDLTGESPKGARVRVFRANGGLLTEGRLDRDGCFQFSYSQAEPLRVVVSAGAGHQKELEISADALAGGLTSGEPATPPTAPGKVPLPAPIPVADRSSRVALKDVLTGVGLVLAVAAFVLSLRNARHLRELTRRYPQADPPRKP